MKPHRQIRSSKKVSSETGCAYGAEQHSPRFYGDKLDEVMRILQSMPIAERKTILADAYKRLAATSPA